MLTPDVTWALIRVRRLFHLKSASPPSTSSGETPPRLVGVDESCGCGSDMLVDVDCNVGGGSHAD